MAPQPIRTNYADDSDILVLEDEVQRIQLLGEITVHNFVTGVVTAVLGRSTLFNRKKRKY